MPDRTPDKPKPNPGPQYLKGDGKFKREEPELGFFQTKLRDKEGLEAQNKRHVRNKKEKETKQEKEEMKVKDQKRKL
ncbi:uncharacterized protein N7443_002507 [Penicillium atrosanguineum]|uniref:Uncharacterized protein n=1 Tax=Penicillium atrosanguineum TaxID=1132637 RepID=A0A9W9PY15_9EURO|nr:uncharacterized protein N7443_002507 [Penicillium atrosanguineum]KAJ5310046.1 hypothetical protein N7443_002507 [Penicillium atrosanguineum]KAJ5315564.1 hypothetical protein N7476_005871 [Penicillium atrosanguineum]